MSERCSPALTQKRQEPSSPTVLIRKCLSLSTAPGLLSLGAAEPWDICHPAALRAGPCHQLCTGIGLCRVQHCRVLGSPLPPSHPSCLPLLLVGIFPAVTTSPLASSWIPLCAPGASFAGCCPSPPPPSGPWWSPSFPLALGRGILHPGALKRQSCLPGASSPKSPFNSHLISGNTLCHMCHPRQMLLQHLPAWLPRVSGQHFRAFPFYPHA